MGRNKRDSGLTSKQDTPIKPATSRRHTRRKVLPIVHYEALPEEPNMEEMTDKPTAADYIRIKPIQGKSAFYSPVHTEYARPNAVLPASHKKPGHTVLPTWSTTIQVNEEGEPKLPVTSKETTFSSTETDSTFDFDNFDDDEEDCYSSTSCGSLPSPEIFREENYVKTMTLPIEDELLSLHSYIKNSTLLDVSHAETIHMHDPPDISTIIDASRILAEMKHEIRNHREPETEVKIQRSPFRSENPEVFKRKTPVRLAPKRPILCKKKVSFKTPNVAEILEAKHIPSTKLIDHSTSEPVHISSLRGQIQTDMETLGLSELNSEDGTLNLRVRLKRPVKSSPEEAKFFDFVSDSDADLFFQRVRERCVKLRSITLFPLTAANDTEASPLSH